MTLTALPVHLLAAEDLLRTAARVLDRDPAELRARVFGDARAGETLYAVVGSDGEPEGGDSPQESALEDLLCQLCHQGELAHGHYAVRVPPPVPVAEAVQWAAAEGEGVLGALLMLARTQGLSLGYLPDLGYTVEVRQVGPRRRDQRVGADLDAHGATVRLALQRLLPRMRTSDVRTRLQALLSPAQP